MLHRVNPPQYAPLLRRVVEFEKALLTWICTPPVAFTLDGVKAALGNDQQAEWLWERIEWGGKRTTFGNLISTAIDYIKQNPVAGQRVLQCAQNDLDFQSHFTDSQFSFYERRFPANKITEAEVEVFKPVLVSLYEKLFDGTGFPANIHQNAAIGNLTRSMWNQNFWDNNLSIGVCPACSGQMPDWVHNSYASDIDHFFPKEKYPFLSIHPDNLIPVCLTCNTKAKHSNDPLFDHTTETLLDTFHPYYCPAIDHVDLYVAPQAGKGITVTVQEKDGARSTRIKNLVRVYDLESRWAKWFERYINSRIETMKSRFLKTKKEVIAFLQEELANDHTYQISQAECFVHARLLSYILDNQQEFDDLCASMGVGI